MGWECMPGWVPSACGATSFRLYLIQGNYIHVWYEGSEPRCGPWRGRWLKCCTPVPAPTEAGLISSFSLVETRSFSPPQSLLQPPHLLSSLVLSFSVHCDPGRRWVLTALCCTLSPGPLSCPFSGSLEGSFHPRSPSPLSFLTLSSGC